MLNIAIVAGGNSGEYEISMKSGRQVEMNIDLNRFRPFLIEIKGTKWNYKVEKKSFPVDKNDFTVSIGRHKISFDAVFNAIHGSPGEDGKLQGYFDMLGIPYTSSGVTTSALSFNKSFCKDVVSANGINVARSIHLYKEDKHPEAGVIENLRLPLFVKPNNGGSSVGMSKVNRKKDLKAALVKSFNEDNEVIVEEFIKGRELTCGDLFRKLNCKGIVRFDYIFNGRKLFFLEVNTVPGLTAASIVPKMAKAYGWSYTGLITKLLDEII